MNIVERVRAARAALGIKCPKFVGAVSVEFLREALADAGIPTSRHNVFIRGLAQEIDLIVPRPGGAGPSFGGVLYEPTEVAVALEVKASGALNAGALEYVRADFQRLRAAGVQPVYVAVEEQEGHRWVITTERLGFPCFTLAWHRRWGGPFTMSDDWDALIALLRHAREPRAAIPRTGTHHDTSEEQGGR